MIDIKKLLVGPVIRLKYVHRFTSCRTLQKESVAEHSYYTTLYALVIAEWYEKRWQENEELGGYIMPDFRKLLSKALVHDLEECITGDIPRDFKHQSVALNTHIDKEARRTIQKVIKDIFQGDESIWTRIWQESKDDSLEGIIISFADFLSVVSYAYEETRVARSLVLKEQLTSLYEYWKSFHSEKYKAFKPLVDQVDVIMEEIFSGTE